MRVMLINPYYVLSRTSIPHTPHEPLALEYLASAICNEHEVQILDCRGEYPHQYEMLPKGMCHIGASLEQIEERILLWQPDVVGITSQFITQTKAVDEIVHLVKSIYKEIRVVVGGCTASYHPEEVLKTNSDIDIVVFGEGEQTFADLLRDLLTNKTQFGVLGTCYRDLGRIFANTPRPLIRDLDTVAIPDRCAVPFDNYSIHPTIWGTAYLWLKAHRYGDLARGAWRTVRRKKSFAIPQYGRTASIITSRGCPFDCYFCAVHNVWGRTYRKRSADNVLEEITQLYQQHDVRHFLIEDDNFNLDAKRTANICEGIIKRSLKVTFRIDSGIYLDNLSLELLKLMKRAGFNELYFGVESGNERVLREIISKKIDLGNVHLVADWCREAGIVSGGYFIIGFPNEGLREMQETIDFALESRLDRIRLYICQPFVGSRMYEDCMRNHWLLDSFEPDKALVFGDKSYMITCSATPDQIEMMAQVGRDALRKNGQLDM